MYDPEPKFQSKVQPRIQPKVMVPSYIKESGQIGNWLFYNGAGDKLYDFSGKKNHGDIIGPKWIDGPYGWALEFDGVDDRADVPSDIVTGTSDITIIAWVKRHATGAFHGVCTHRDGGYRGEWIFTIQDTDLLRWAIYESAWQFDLTSTTTIAADEWWHLAGVRSGSDGFLYVNGDQEDSGTGTIQSIDPTFTTSIGHDVRSDYPLDGLIALVQMFDVAKSAGFIGEHFERTRAIFGV